VTGVLDTTIGADGTFSSDNHSSIDYSIVFAAKN
jgi:hypothetical protein